MRTRFVLLVVALLLVAGFAALNWSEITRPAPLLFGPVVMDAPMGAILLALLGIATLLFAVTVGTIRTQALMESRQHFKTLEAQRTLADKAEASRFTDLRQHLDTQLRELRERDGVHLSESHRAMLEGQRELRAQLEQINRTLVARLSEIEHRLDTRLDRLQVPGQGAPAMAATARPPVQRETVPAQQMPREHVAAEPPLGGPRPPMAAERLPQQPPERPQAQPAPQDPPGAPQAGWRRWF